MGKSNPATDVINTAKSRYPSTTEPTPTENEFVPFSQNLNNQATSAFTQNRADYGNVMGAYNDFRSGLGGPSKFSFNKVGASRPEELGQSYGFLKEAMPGYRDFAATGGYSPTDVQELRARGVSPIRSAYGNTMQEMDRARALGGNGGAPNYIAAASKAQRELPGQMADAMTTVNAGLADSIRQGKQFGLQGMTGTGATMGGLASAEAGRQLQADIQNQGADIQTQGMGEGSLQALRGNQLASMGGQASLYGTTPGLSSMFGNQAMSSYQLRNAAEQSRNQFGLGLLGAQIQGQQAQPKPWWQTALEVAGNVAPYVAMA